ncbi:hypothetical protein ATANTOWER_015205 [Ataeniobius toweri]|uniref:Uncharacterized protein n=1 Tax=Ataeniobius toweri TaxID=208326 RepID=A0ABU7B0N4_9TELE|nr:hypothetical protein [Ataeniobius toweri]
MLIQLYCHPGSSSLFKLVLDVFWPLNTSILSLNLLQDVHAFILTSFLLIFLFIYLYLHSLDVHHFPDLCILIHPPHYPPYPTFILLLVLLLCFSNPPASSCFSSSEVATVDHLIGNKKGDVKKPSQV